MSRRRLVPLALLVTALVALAAVAAHGRPLSGAGVGSGPSMTFYGYLWTTFLIVLVLCAIATAVALIAMRRRIDEQQRKPYQQRTARALAILLAMAALLFFLGRHINLEHLLHPHQPTVSTPTGRIPIGKHHRKSVPPQHVHFFWQEFAIVFGILLLLAAAAALRSRRRPGRVRLERVQEELAVALDDSLDDLRADPDLRRAIVAAYARMERTLAAAGVPRHPAEAPLEYLERALLALDASAGAVRRLTELFEWARFSHHEPEPRMRDEAVDALVAIRDELRTPEPVPA